jgi:hypothetical protein
LGVYLGVRVFCHNGAWSNDLFKRSV